MTVIHERGNIQKAVELKKRRKAKVDERCRLGEVFFEH